MKSKKILGLLLVLFMMQVWSSEQKEIETENYEKLTQKQQEQYEGMKKIFTEVDEEKLLSLLLKKSRFDENLEPNTKPNEKINELVLDLSTFKSIDQNVWQVWSYFLFPFQSLCIEDVNWENVKYFKFTEKKLDDNKEIYILIYDIDGVINLDPDFHHFPKYISELIIYKSDVNSLRFSAGTNIRIFTFHDPKLVQWEKIDLPQIKTFNIFGINYENMVNVKGIENIQNATRVNELQLDLCLLPQELNLRKFTNLKSLKISSCRWAEKHSIISQLENIENVTFKNSNIENIKLSEEIRIDTLIIWVNDREGKDAIQIIQWENVYVPQLKELKIDLVHNIEGIKNIKNADRVQSLTLKNVKIEKLDLCKFYNLKDLHLENCILSAVTNIKASPKTNDDKEFKIVLKNIKVQELDLLEFQNLKSLTLENCTFSSATKIKTSLETNVVDTDKKLKNNKNAAQDYVTYTYCESGSNCLII